MNLKKIQKEVWENKVNKGFNTTNAEKEFCLLYGELQRHMRHTERRKMT